MRKLQSLFAGLVLAAAATAALASPPAILRQDITSQGNRVTLGDLFYDAGAASGVIAARVQPGQTAVLDATQVQILARASGVDWGNPQGLRRIIVSPAAAAEAPAAPVSSALVPLSARSAAASRAAKSAAVLTYLHSINTGDIIRAEDLAWSKEAVAGLDAPRDPDAVVGMAARRPLREGAPASLRDFAAPQVIKKDDLISVAFKTEGVSLTLQAKAMENATVGQAFTVINPISKKIIQAVASGPGEAVVGPEADQLKSEARSGLSRLALR